MKDAMQFAIKGIGIIIGVRAIHGMVMGVIGEGSCHQEDCKKESKVEDEIPSVEHCPHHHVAHAEFTAKELLEDIALGAINMLGDVVAPPSGSGSWGEYLANRSNSSGRVHSQER